MWSESAVAERCLTRRRRLNPDDRRIPLRQKLLAIDGFPRAGERIDHPEPCRLDPQHAEGMDTHSRPLHERDKRMPKADDPCVIDTPDAGVGYSFVLRMNEEFMGCG